MPGSPAPLADDLLARALAEDFGVSPGTFLDGRVTGVLERDVTTAAVVPRAARFAGEVVCRERGVVCGLAHAARAWELLAAASGCTSPAITRYAEEGEQVERGASVARVEGPAAVVLGGERTALNVLMVLSGIATEASRWQEAAGPAVTVLDTRKTLPGLRALSKWAVEMGGATPHRAGLWDMALVKDNHIRLAGGVSAAIEAARGARPGLAIEVEADSIEAAEEAVRAGADIVMLDNMDAAVLAAAVSAVRGAATAAGRRVFTEASGGVTLDRLALVVSTGVDRVSTSALGLARPLDFGLDEYTERGT